MGENLKEYSDRRDFGSRWLTTSAAIWPFGPARSTSWMAGRAVLKRTSTTLLRIATTVPSRSGETEPLWCRSESCITSSIISLPAPLNRERHTWEI